MRSTKISFSVRINLSSCTCERRRFLNLIGAPTLGALTHCENLTKHPLPSRVARSWNIAAYIFKACVPLNARCGSGPVLFPILVIELD